MPIQMKVGPHDSVRYLCSQSRSKRR